jgi:hypothetical protein
MVVKIRMSLQYGITYEVGDTTKINFSDKNFPTIKNNSSIFMVTGKSIYPNMDNIVELTLMELL